MSSSSASVPPCATPVNQRKLCSMMMGSTLLLCWVVTPFVAAGTLRWGTGWLYIIVTAAGLVIHRAYVVRRNPELLARRREIGQGTKTWDKLWNAVFWPLMLAIPVVAGADVVRLRGLRMPPGVFAVGIALYGLGMAMSAWAMGANPFFEGTVRIQRDRGHRVVDVGPYRYVRHPGYVGLILWALGTPFLLGSWWALVPTGITVAWVAIRTSLEDRTLRRELAGYEEYVRRVRCRLLPGLW